MSSAVSILRSSLSYRDCGDAKAMQSRQCASSHDLDSVGDHHVTDELLPLYFSVSAVARARCTLHRIAITTCTAVNTAPGGWASTSGYSDMFLISGGGIRSRGSLAGVSQPAFVVGSGTPPSLSSSWTPYIFYCTTDFGLLVLVALRGGYSGSCSYHILSSFPAARKREL